MKLIDIFRQKDNSDLIYDAINNITYTYNDFLDSAYKYYNYIKNKGLQPNDKVVVVMHNSVDLLCIYFACLLGHWTVVPLDPLLGEDVRNKIIEKIDFSVIINGNEDITDGVLTNKTLLDNIDYDYPFLITHTSGTTGDYKGVIHSLNNLIKSAEKFGKNFGYSEDDIFYHNLPMTYMAGILNLFILPLIHKCKIVVDERFDIKKAGTFWQKPAQYKCKIFWMTPTIVSILNKLDRGECGINYIQGEKPIIHVGTAPLYDEVRNKFESKYNINLYSSYGLSETLFIATEMPQKKHISGATGNILEGVSYKIIDDELCFKTGWDFKGYTNVETNTFYIDSYYKSGDLGKIVDNNLFITGRKKDLIIKGGINISIQALENFLYDMKSFDELAVIGIKDDIVIEKIICFYTSNEIEVNKNEINKKVVESFGIMYKVDEFKKIEFMPKNINGKIDKNKLREFVK